MYIMNKRCSNFDITRWHYYIYAFHSLSYSLHASAFNIDSNYIEAVTVTTGGDVTVLNITGLTPFTNYTVYVEGVTVEIGDKSDNVIVMTLEDGEGVNVVVYVYLCIYGS